MCGYIDNEGICNEMFCFNWELLVVCVIFVLVEFENLGINLVCMVIEGYG